MSENIYKEGQKVDNFCLKDDQGSEFCLEENLGKWIVLYFYPKDNTPGCTKEAKQFTEKKEEFENLDAFIIGISPDSVKSHQKFKEKHNLDVKLLSDPEHEVLEKFGVWQKKNMFGRKFMGVVRSTLLINPAGKIEKAWKKVKVKGHAEDVKCSIDDLQ
ncbi:MAG: peroxiredoxin [Candidatus Marinimicrobia bacterium]|nr:peroxiredoxin [Candidatus Neomarinimicrobiota bacterium]